jgi:hypothetical protein
MEQGKQWGKVEVFDEFTSTTKGYCRLKREISSTFLRSLPGTGLYGA